MNIEYVIPPGNLRWLREAPSDRPVLVLLRHSVRPPLPGDERDYYVPIDEKGRELAEELGKSFGKRLKSVHASPLVRCVQTAELLAQGAGVDLQVEASKLLGDPTVYVLDPYVAWEKTWKKMRNAEVVRRMIDEDQPLPGMADPDLAARYLLLSLFASAGERPGFHAFVTHDTVIMMTIGRFLDFPLEENWAWFLEGAFFWRTERGFAVAYRDFYGEVELEQFCTFSEDDVSAFARRELVPVIGYECPARFFFAGGAFRSLLTGSPPRDLDLWAPDERNRDSLIETLKRRGAKYLGQGNYNDRFEIADRIVEVGFSTRAKTLEERLYRFDLGLSAVGVEHLPGMEIIPMVAPEAVESLERREILLLKDLPNWPFALSSLARAHRYSRELNFALPRETEERLLRIYWEQPEDIKREMWKRLENSPYRDEIPLIEERVRWFSR